MAKKKKKRSKPKPKPVPTEPKVLHPLTRWRFENGRMSLAAFGKLVRASAPHLSDIENGEKNPSVGLLLRLYEVTKLPKDQIAADVIARLMEQAALVQAA